MAISTDVASRQVADIDAPITNGEINTLYRLANALSQSQFFRDARQAQQAFAKLLFGRDMGLSATQAMTDIHIVEGKPEMSANLHASKVLSSDKYDYTVLVLDENECSIEFTRIVDGKRLGVSTFTMEDAKKAGLTKPSRNGSPSNYAKFGRNMLFARAMTNGVAWFCPDVFNGIRVYAEGEVSETIAPAAPEPAPTPPPVAGLAEEKVAELAKGITAAGWDDDRLAMELIDLGLVEVDDPLDKIAALDDEQAEKLQERLDQDVDQQNGGEDDGD